MSNKDRILEISKKEEPIRYEGCDFFTCSYCGYFQIDDGGNYKCWTCEDGNIPKDNIPEWRTKNKLDWSYVRLRSVTDRRYE